ncbi:MAG: metal ABC transporter ATP-binding protein [Corynebacterium sp.]|nr:metal ABC transporter ATP-binding protein [Corynebacterium sp.]
MSPIILQCRDISWSYPGSQPALRNITLDLDKGQLLALIGPNGCGKSTFLKGVLGQLHSSGEIQAPAPAQIGYVPQSTSIDPTFPISAVDVVRMGILTAKPWWAHLNRGDKQRARAALADVGLLDRADMQFGNLSGGQQQRVLLARALAKEPSLVLLDEPFNGLDQPNRDALLATIEQLKERGVSIIASTHDLALVHGIADQVAVLNRKLIAYGPPEQVMTRSILDTAYGEGYYAH